MYNNHIISLHKQKMSVSSLFGRIRLMIVFSSFLLGVGHSQSHQIPLTASIYAPYGTNMGVQVGTSFPFRSMEGELENGKWQLRIGPEISYFELPSVNRHVYFNADISIG